MKPHNIGWWGELTIRPPDRGDKFSLWRPYWNRLKISGTTLHISFINWLNFQIDPLTGKDGGVVLVHERGEGGGVYRGVDQVNGVCTVSKWSESFETWTMYQLHVDNELTKFWLWSDKRKVHFLEWEWVSRPTCTRSINGWFPKVRVPMKESSFSLETCTIYQLHIHYYVTQFSYWSDRWEPRNPTPVSHHPGKEMSEALWCENLPGPERIFIRTLALVQLHTINMRKHPTTWSTPLHINTHTTGTKLKVDWLSRTGVPCHPPNRVYRYQER